MMAPVHDVTSPACPRCASPGQPILWGYPTHDAVEALTAQHGGVVLGGCAIPDDDEPGGWQCTTCGHRWGEVDEPFD